MAGKFQVAVYYSDGSLKLLVSDISEKEAHKIGKRSVANGKRYGFKHTYSVGEV